jgi:uncharacterized protein YggE
MRRIVEVGTLTAVLSACAGPSAGGQATPSDAESLGRLHIYEVPSERMADAQSQEAPEPGWIQVDGSGSVDVTPDRATVSFAVETRAATAGDAGQSNADAMDSVLRALRAAQLPGLELETFGYSLRPEYSRPDERGTREIVAYTAVNNVRATISDPDMVGRVIDAAIGAGANRIGGISFFASDTREARNEAMAQAVREATAEARVIAETLGHELGPPLEVNGGAQPPRPIMRGPVTFEAAQAAPTPIEAGDQTVTATVSIRFALGPRTAG